MWHLTDRIAHTTAFVTPAMENNKNIIKNNNTNTNNNFKIIKINKYKNVFLKIIKMHISFKQ